MTGKSLETSEPATVGGQSPAVAAARPKRSGLIRRVVAVSFSLIVFAASVGYIGLTFRWGDLAQVLKGVNLLILVGGGGASIVAYWALRTLRWRVLLRRTDTHVPLVDLYMCTAVSLSFALFTPLQSGEALKVELLKKYGMITRAPGYGSFLVERAFDMVALLTMACVSLLTVVDVLPNRVYAYGILGCLILGCFAGLVVLSRLQLSGRPRQLLETMRQCVGNVPTLVLVTAITCASWSMVAVGWQVTLYSGGIDLSFAQTVSLMSIVALIAILSLIPGGLGITEVGTSQLLIRFGFAATIAQAGSLLLRSYSLLNIALGAGHLGLWKLVRWRRSRRLGRADATESLAATTNAPVS
jgi:uncharacterized membrane protein YbhN (UPF0104 family)